MQIFLDSANLHEIEEMINFIDGVTTNPSLIAKTGQNFKELITGICKLVKGSVSVEVISTDIKGMLEEGRSLGQIAPNLTIKLPLTLDGLKACKILTKEGYTVNVTLCFSPMQALLAAKAGASYVSPFVGRLDDIAFDGMSLIEDIAQIFNNYKEIKTKILVASVRHPIHMLRAAKIGADIVTIPAKVLKQLIEHPLTERGLAMFLEDWKKAQSS